MTKAPIGAFIVRMQKSAFFLQMGPNMVSGLFIIKKHTIPLFRKTNLQMNSFAIRMESDQCKWENTEAH